MLAQHPPASSSPTSCSHNTSPRLESEWDGSCSSQGTQGLAPTMHQHCAPHLLRDDAALVAGVGRIPSHMHDTAV